MFWSVKALFLGVNCKACSFWSVIFDFLKIIHPYKNCYSLYYDVSGHYNLCVFRSGGRSQANTSWEDLDALMSKMMMDFHLPSSSGKPKYPNQNQFRQYVWVILYFSSFAGYKGCVQNWKQKLIFCHKIPNKLVTLIYFQVLSAVFTVFHNFHS